jgi:pimeloyl-ACP methyl ester carboxylesterase
VVIRGHHDAVAGAGEERRALEARGTRTLVTVPDAAHFSMTDQPARIAEIVLDAARRSGQ